MEKQFSTKQPFEELLSRFLSVRNLTHSICEPLQIEDYVIQVSEEASPAKWHLAHTSWFFEEFLLKKFCTSYSPFHPKYSELFNSYYQTVGPVYSRPHRSHLSRPTVNEIFEYRKYVDHAMENFLLNLINKTTDHSQKIIKVLELGIQHEQQHQELLLMDIKLNLGFHPWSPSYREKEFINKTHHSNILPLQWVNFKPDLTSIGVSSNEKFFAFDNEQPAHSVFVAPFQFSNRLITNDEFKEFIQDGGYQKSSLWLSDGWNWVRNKKITAPLYWQQKDDEWFLYTLNGLKKVIPPEPVCHLSYYEADAFARWHGSRLPRETEWESVAQLNLLNYFSDENNNDFLEGHQLHPSVLSDSNSDNTQNIYQLHGTLWEWTQSAYEAYPRFRSFSDSFSEYNGKFMCNQIILRGGSCITPVSHYRPTYRNFFFPHQRWMFSGLRLARDL